MRISNYKACIQVILEQTDKPLTLKGCTFPAGVYNLYAVSNIAPKSLRSLMDIDYIPQILDKAKSGDMLAALTLIWLDAFLASQYRGNFAPFERIGKSFTAEERSAGYSRAYAARCEVTKKLGKSNNVA